MDKIQGIIEAREQGRVDSWIGQILLRSGVTPSKIRELLSTASLASDVLGAASGSSTGHGTTSRRASGSTTGPAGRRQTSKSSDEKEDTPGKEV
jgi:hypothetical protein